MASLTRCAKFYPIIPTLTCDAEISLSIRERNSVNDNGLSHPTSHASLYECSHQLQHCCEMLSNCVPMVTMCLAALLLVTIGCLLRRRACVK